VRGGERMFPWNEPAERQLRALEYLDRKGQEREEKMVRNLGVAIGLLWVCALALFVMLWYS